VTARVSNWPILSTSSSVIGEIMPVDRFHRDVGKSGEITRRIDFGSCGTVGRFMIICSISKATIKTFADPTFTLDPSPSILYR
jgi:hypothetical protein